MKKICLFLLFVSTMLSCSVVEKRTDKWPAPDIVANFKGGQSEDADTKTALEFDPTMGTSHVYWCPGDELNIFFDTKSVKYKSTNTENSRSAVLRTAESVSEEEFLSTNLWGLYPYDEDAVCDGSSIVTSLSNSQSGVSNSFDDDLALMVAKCSDRNMFFMNVCGGLKFSLTRDDIKSITFRGNNGENLSGQLKIQIEDGQPVVTCKDGDKSVTLTPKEGDTFEKDVDYILMTLPANLEKGFSMSFDLDNARGELVYEKAVSLPRGDLGVKRSIDALATFEYDVTGLSLDKTSASMKVGESIQLVATILPENATDKNVIWSSSDESVATVTDGNVTAVSLGTCTIMATSGEFSAACEITVVPTLVTSVTLDKTTATLRAGETVTLTATVNPEDATDKTVEWSTSDASVATVENGVITAVKVGTATITAKAGDKTATCEIAVVPTPVTSVTLDKTEVSLKEGEQVKLYATISPTNATNKTVLWSSANSNVASVDGQGNVSAISVGSAVITVTTEDGNFSASCFATVSEEIHPVLGVSLNKTTLELNKGESETLLATVYPENATNKNVTWESDHPDIVSVNNSGEVKAVGGGFTRVMVITDDGSWTAICNISVSVPVTGVTLDKVEASMKVGEQLQLNATIAPGDATNKNCVWESSNQSLAIVEDGLVTAIKPGNVTISVKSEDGNKTAYCNVKIKSDGFDPSIGEWVEGEGGEGTAE